MARRQDLALCLQGLLQQGRDLVHLVKVLVDPRQVVECHEGLRVLQGLHPDLQLESQFKLGGRLLKSPLVLQDTGEIVDRQDRTRVVSATQRGPGLHEFSQQPFCGGQSPELFLEHGVRRETGEGVLVILPQDGAPALVGSSQRTRRLLGTIALDQRPAHVV
jgi:hypothetical protein